MRQTLKEKGVKGAQQRELIEDIVWAVASMFEDGRMTLGGRRFRPALRFLTELGEAVPPTGSFSLRDYVDGMVEQAFNDGPQHGYPTHM